MSFKYEYTKTPVCLQRLENEIKASAIVTALDYMTLLGSTLSIYFKAELSVGDASILDALVTAHTGEAMPPEAVLMQLESHDTEDRPFVRNVVTHVDWYYSPHSLDFYSSKYKSLYNRKHDGNGIDDGTDVGDAELLFYDASGTLLTKGEAESDEEFQIRLTANCVKTIMSWEKVESFEVNGALLYILNNPTERAYVWVIAAPDIPYEYGGSKPFMGRGMNLQMMEAKKPHYFDAKTTAPVIYDPVYHSGKVACVVKHGVGVQIGIQLIYIVYEE